MKLKELRKENNKTQEEVAKLLDTSVMNYNRYENERVEPNIATLSKLADYYDVSLDYLVGRQWKYDVGFLTNEQFNFVKLYLKLQKDSQNKLFGFAMSLFAEQN